MNGRWFWSNGGYFMCSVEKASKINDNFMITNLILSMEGTFTCDDICEKIGKSTLSVGKKTVEKTLKRLRENDYLDEIGYTYRVIPKEKSVRWGWN